MTRRDRLLKQMGITQWTLRNPSALRGERGVRIPESAKLVIISEEEIDLNNRLLNDILLTLKIDKADVICIDSEQLGMVPSPMSVSCWVIGDCRISETHQIQLTSPTLTSISTSSEAKRSLWKQIYQYDENFNIKAV